MIRSSAAKTSSIAYLLGVYLGDGWMGYVRSNKTYLFRLNTIDKDFAETVMDSFETVLGRRTKIHCHPVPRSKNLNYSIGIGCKNLFWFIKATRNKSRIPEYVWNLSDENKKSFISGIMDSEGYAAKHRNYVTVGVKATGLWMKDFYRLIRSLGIKTGGLLTERIKSGKVAYYFRINTNSWFNSGCCFNIKRKQRRVELYVQRLYVERESEDIVRTSVKAGEDGRNDHLALIG